MALKVLVDGLIWIGWTWAVGTFSKDAPRPDDHLRGMLIVTVSIVALSVSIALFV